MEIQKRRKHLEFDMAAAANAYRQRTDLEGEQITSPFDLFSVETLRKKHGIKSPPTFATDVFVWGKGAPKKPYLTKISGLPYWPKRKPWPKDESGAAMLFLAQLCFLDSTDIVPTLPGDVLLMFVPPDEDQEWMWEPSLIQFEWLKVSDQPLLEKLPAGVKSFSDSEWYGVIYRTSDFPDVEPPEGLAQSYNLPVLNATKIGGVPHGIQPGSGSYEANADGLPERTGFQESDTPQGNFIGQLTSVQAAPEAPFPWTNQNKELVLNFGETGIYDDSQQCLFGDMGSIYIYMTEDGTCSASMECY